MSESTTPAHCRDEDWKLARESGLMMAGPGTNAWDAALGRFADAVRAAHGVKHNDADDDPTSKAQYRRMFQAACSDLGLINEKLGLDPNDGGAEPILAAIDELLATSTAAGQGDLVAAVRAMLTMLDSGEWAEHAAATTGRGNPLAQRLEDAITDLHNEASANRDMLDDARTELDMLRQALGVPYEPHQTLRERLLDAAQRAIKAETNNG